MRWLAALAGGRAVMLDVEFSVCAILAIGTFAEKKSVQRLPNLIISVDPLVKRCASRRQLFARSVQEIHHFAPRFDGDISR
ncbi:hypothetical protein ACC808_07685 [Rhizobium ruizarguesonis]